MDSNCSCLPGFPFNFGAQPELVSVGVLPTCPKVELKDDIETVPAMYANGDLYVVQWREWYSNLLTRVPEAVHKPKMRTAMMGTEFQEEAESTPPKTTMHRKVKREVGSESKLEEVDKNKKKMKKEGQQ